MELIEDLQRHISQSLLAEAAPDAPDLDVDLSRLLDSMQFLLLARHVEDRYRIEVADEEISLQHFGSLRALAEFIRRKRG